jgi:Mg2+ and Co2+ transporter CorA
LDQLAAALDEKKIQIDNTSETSYYNQLIDDYNQAVQTYNSMAENLKLLVANYNSQVKIFNDCVAGAKK